MEDCNHLNYIIERGDRICTDCGLILEERIPTLDISDYTPEINNHVKAGTFIYPKGTPLRWNSYVRLEHYEVKLAIDRCCKFFEIPESVKNRAFYLFTKYIRKLYKGKFHVYIGAASVLLACQERGFLLEFEQLINYFQERNRRFTKARFRKVLRDYKENGESIGDG